MCVCVLGVLVTEAGCLSIDYMKSCCGITQIHTIVNKYELQTKVGQ